ncbi:MAG: membrane protein insertion efficiency factor YidD, partial [Gemmatimonadales bacterium]
MDPRLGDTTALAEQRIGPVAWMLTVLVRGYQMFLSPILPASCRFDPSCSQYALMAIRRHGAVRGVWLAARRLARCHPWNPGGHDPVP